MKFNRIAFFLLGFIFTSNAQDSVITHRSARVEVGLGIGFAGEGGGFSGRLAFSYLNHNWGATVKTSAYNGGKGTNSSWIGRPKVESFYDNAILLSRVITNNNSLQTIASVGVGWVNGRRFVQPNQLEVFGPITGLAYELGVASTGSTVGFNFSIMGNLNTESSLIGLVISATLGYQK